MSLKNLTKTQKMALFSVMYGYGKKRLKKQFGKPWIDDFQDMIREARLHDLRTQYLSGQHTDEAIIHKIKDCTQDNFRVLKLFKQWKKEKNDPQTKKEINKI